MQYEIEVGGRVRQVTVTRTGAAFAVTVDGHTRQVDAVRIDAHTLSLIVDGVWSKDAAVVPDGGSGQAAVIVNGTPVAVAINGRRGHRDDGGHRPAPGPQR